MFRKSVCGLVAFLMFSGCQPHPEQDEAPKSTATDKAIPAILVSAWAVYGAVQKAYDVYNKVRTFLDGAPSVAQQIEAAKTEIVNELNRMQMNDLAERFNAQVRDYGEIVRNPYHPSSLPRLYTWMSDSSSLFEALRIHVAQAEVDQRDSERLISNAYNLAPAFNAIAAMRISVMRGVPEMGFPELDQTSINNMLYAIREANYHLVGANYGNTDAGPVEPFWGSVFWKSSKFAGYGFSCGSRGCSEDGGSYSTSYSCWVATGTCSWHCNDNDSGTVADPYCVNPEAEKTKARWLEDGVIACARLGLAHATVSLGDYWIWDGNWGWVNIIEA